MKGKERPPSMLWYKVDDLLKAVIRDLEHDGNRTPVAEFKSHVWNIRPQTHIDRGHHLINWRLLYFCSEKSLLNVDILCFGYTTITAYLLNFMHCVEIEGDWFMISDVIMDCINESSQKWFIVTSVLLLWCVCACFVSPRPICKLWMDAIPEDHLEYICFWCSWQYQLPYCLYGYLWLPYKTLVM